MSVSVKSCLLEGILGELNFHMFPQVTVSVYMLYRQSDLPAYPYYAIWCTWVTLTLAALKFVYLSSVSYTQPS